MALDAPPHTTLPAAAGLRLRDRLAGPDRAARVLHTGRDAVYLEHDGWALGVLSERAVPVACALVLPGWAQVDLARVERATVGAGRVELVGADGSATVRVTRLTDLAVPRLPAAPPAYVVGRMHAHAALAADELGPLGDLSDPGPLLGRGSGLTPLGDDVLAGWAATAYAKGTPVPPYDARDRTTLLSATLLDCAQRGEVLPQFRALVGVLVGPDDPDAVDRAAAALATVGHTSGAGLLLGVALRLERG